MKPFSSVGVWRIAWILLGLLAISAAIMSLGNTDMSSKPSATSYAPSGTAAMAELLKRNGYTVDISNSVNPSLQRGDLAVCFLIEGSDNELVVVGQGGKNQAKHDVTTQTKGSIARFLAEGGAAIVLSIPNNFQDAQQVDQPANDFLGLKSGHAVARQYPEVSTAGLDQDYAAQTLRLGARNDTQPVAFLTKYGKGYAISLFDGIIATNRYIDRGDNAALLLRSIGLVARPGARIEFVEGTWGNASPPGLMEVIGPWALGAWRQLIVLTAVIIYTLGRRFGIGIVTHVPEQGSKELVDALANIYQRSKSAQLALRVAVERAEILLRKRLKLTREITGRELAHKLPEPLSKTLLAATGLAADRIDSVTAVETARKLDREVEEYLRASRVGARM